MPPPSIGPHNGRRLVDAFVPSHRGDQPCLIGPELASPGRSVQPLVALRCYSSGLMYLNRPPFCVAMVLRPFTAVWSVECSSTV